MMRRLFLLSISIALGLTCRPALSAWEALGPPDAHQTWLYTPDHTLKNGRHGLMLVLHGCLQSNADLKQFGNLEKSAEENGLVLALPFVGERSFGLGRCWDYNAALDQSGNAEDLIALTRNLLADTARKIDAGQIYVVGLSSGAAESLLLGCKAPDLFAGIGAIAGPSVGSDQWGALVDATMIPGTNVENATRACRMLAGPKAALFATQIANIAYGDMDRDGPKAKTAAADQPAAPVPGQIAVVSIEWNLDNIRILRNIYGASALGRPVQIQDGKGTERTAIALGVPRLSLLVVHDVGHAWPAGDNHDGSGGFWIAHQGLNYPAYIVQWFLCNNRRSPSNCPTR